MAWTAEATVLPLYLEETIASVKSLPSKTGILHCGTGKTPLKETLSHGCSSVASELIQMACQCSHCGQNSCQSGSLLCVYVCVKGKNVESRQNSGNLRVPAMFTSQPDNTFIDQAESNWTAQCPLCRKAKMIKSAWARDPTWFLCGSYAFDPKTWSYRLLFFVQQTVKQNTDFIRAYTQDTENYMVMRANMTNIGGLTEK